MSSVKQTSNPSDNAEAKRVRAQSGIAYPYFNLQQSVKVAQAIHEKGGGACTADQLASFLGYTSVRSGTYLTRVSAARLFGLILSHGDQIGITDRARAIISPVMPEDGVAAKVDAFLAVPLFSRTYEEFKGQTLPPEIGLKNLFENKFKIVKDRVGPAVRVFYESADHAGFFSVGGDRTKLIKPVGHGSSHGAASTAQAPESKDTSSVAPQERPRGTGFGDGPPGVHPAIVGLLRELPPAGNPWPNKEKFLKAFQTTLDFIYPEEGDSTS
jgi:hypothetical protein